MEFVDRDPHPFTQSIPRRVGKRDTAVVHFGPWRLAGDQDARRRRYLDDRSRTERQEFGARAARANFGEQGIQRLHALQMGSYGPLENDRQTTSIGRAKVAEQFKVGDRVGWNSEAGHVSGMIIKIHIRDFDYKGHTHRASPDSPQYEIKSSKTDHIAAHKGSALSKLSD